MRRSWSGLLVCVLVIAALPASASAVVVQAAGGQRYGVFLRPGVSPSALSSAQVPASPRVGQANGNLDYNGGPVLHSSAPYLIFWDPNSGLTTQSKGILERYLSDTAADSGRATNVYSVLRQYTDSTGVADYKQTFSAGQAIVDATTYPTRDPSCSTGAGFPNCLTDAQLQAEVTRLIGARSLPTGIGPGAPIYFVITPADTNICMPGGICASNRFCAYHSSFAPVPSQVILYAAVPFIVWTLNPTKGCQHDGNPAVYQTPNRDQADGIADNVSHELSETITDPLGDAWYNATGGNEVGDNCESYGSTAAPFSGQSPNAYEPTLGGTESLGTLYDQSINGNRYYTQTEWSNGDVGCDTQTSADTLTPAFTATASDTIVSFDPTSSTTSTGPITSASWDFGDGSTAFSTGAPAPTSHSYAIAGNFTVTLTLVDAFGNLAKVSHSVAAGALPASTGPTSGNAGAPVTVAASGSTGTAGLGPVAITAPPSGSTVTAGLGSVKVAGSTAAVAVKCNGAGPATCSVTLELSVTETRLRGKVIAVGASAKASKKTVLVGKVTATLAAGQTRTIQISPNRAGGRLLAKLHKLKVTLTLLSAGKTVSHTTVTLTAKKQR